MHKTMHTKAPTGKVVYSDVSLKGMTLELAAYYKELALPTVQEILKSIQLTTPSGEPVTVSVKIDDLDMKRFRGAYAGRTSPGRYWITIGAGLVTQLSITARAIAADKRELRGRTKSRLLSKDVRRDGREKALGDFIFHFMLMFVVWHEVSHISLGHIDWLDLRTGLGVIDEFSLEPLESTIFTYRQTLEADADRQACIWSAALIDDAAENNLYLRYTSLPDLFYDVGYLFGALFQLMDAVDPRKVPTSQRLHPKADVRLGVALTFVLEYLQKKYPLTSELLHTQVIAGGLAVLARSHHAGKEHFNPAENAAFIIEAGVRIDEMKLREFGHKIDDAGPSSFEVEE